jgi:Flp pilus assembly protein, ATPase CpaF
MEVDPTTRRETDAMVGAIGTPFMDLFNDPEIVELGVNGTGTRVWVDSRSEGMVQTDVEISDAEVGEFLSRAATLNDDVLNSDSPDIECALPEYVFDGARLSGARPPATKSSSFCLRTFEDTLIPLPSYVEDSIMSQRQYERIIQAITNLETIAVVGGTSSGKSTLLMTIVNEMGARFPGERVVTIEDTKEIFLETTWNWHPFYTHGSDQSRAGSIRSLVESSLRWSPKRIIVGECRGPGIVALFSALQSGHPGGAFTFHSNSIEKFFERVYGACCEDSDTEQHKNTIGRAVDLIIILEKAHGVRYVKQMAKLHEYDMSTGEYHYDLIHRDPASPRERYIPSEVVQRREEAQAQEAV